MGWLLPGLDPVESYVCPGCQSPGDEIAAGLAFTERTLDGLRLARAEGREYPTELVEAAFVEAARLCLHGQDVESLRDLVGAG